MKNEKKKKEKRPNEKTREAIEQLENGMGKSSDTVEELFKDLNKEE